VIGLVARVGVTLALAACASAPTVERVPAAPLAKLSMVNLTDQVWRIAFSAAGQMPPRTVEVAPRGQSDIELAAGEWLVDQALVNGEGRPTVTRRFPSRLEAGESYRWPLATLQTIGDAGGGGR
jgi:hypothetical protein